MIAQIAGASALIAAIAMPRLAFVPPPPAAGPAPAAVAPANVAPAATPVWAVPAAIPRESAVPPTRAVAETPKRPAHLNLDVRHAFRSMDLSITVDGRSVLDTTLEGSGKRFKVFGKRSEKGYTKTLDLSPGVRVVRVRVKSTSDKFDQTRVERFDLDSASVAGMRIAADKTGLSIVADRPQIIERPIVTQVPQVAPVAPVAPVAQVAAVAQVAQAAQEASALAELYQTLRQVLIAVAGFIASAATGYVVQEFLRSRKGVMGL